MLFNTLDYARFFAVVFVASWLLVKARKTRILFLLVASYVFYAHWDYRFLPLIWGSSTADFFLARAIARATDARKRKWLLIGTVFLNLGVLAIFKYFNFGIDTARALLQALGYSPPDIALHIALPVGISFFTFESMSYVIDIYRGELAPHKSYIEYLTFVAFFPHLVAGPIVRPRDLLPQLAERARFSAEVGSEGLFLIAQGLLKKVAIGDYLAVNLIDRVFDAPLQFSAVECYAAVVAYAVQIYCDFSGYTDIAIGSALLLGVRFPLNFDAPYQAHNIADFWRRWHISLSTWLRDYLYIPLGGNRKGRSRTYFNLIVTMLLGGLWHGASFTFVVWGGLHGVALALNRAWHEFLASRVRSPGTTEGRADEQDPSPGLTRDPAQARPFSAGRAGLHVVKVVLTFHFVCFTWVFFRSTSFDQAGLMLQRLGSSTTHHQNLTPGILGILALGLVSHFTPRLWWKQAEGAFVRLPAVGQALVLFVAALVLTHLATGEAVPFVYFQF